MLSQGLGVTLPGTCHLISTFSHGFDLCLISPLDLSCRLAALGPRVFEGSYITCQRNYSSSRHCILTHIHTFSLVSTFSLDVVAVAASIWSIALLFAADLVRIASEVSLLSETASKI